MQEIEDSRGILLSRSSLNLGDHRSLGDTSGGNCTSGCTIAEEQLASVRILLDIKAVNALLSLELLNSLGGEEIEILFHLIVD